ncbi:MAG: hypothetical protein OEZ02_12365, partial [Anaerolineae bacterium]|nr:hypothetical protein [Anaerolineae bacterium]
IVLLDKEGVFWIIQSKDGIYRYDPSQEKTELIKKLDKDVRDAVLTPYGGIFIVYRNISSPPIFTFQEGDLLYYDIELGSLSEITPPEEIWPSIYTIAVDSAGNLWLDSNGWRTPDGEWHLINTYIDKESLATGIGVDWTTARHLATSSNGFVWLYKLPNIGQHTGQAWYDTKSREGCWFTTDFYSLMIEDADQNLWMILDDKLYKLDLDS